jgi:hypothetical protein
MFPLGSQNVSIFFMKELAKNQQAKVSSFDWSIGDGSIK